MVNLHSAAYQFTLIVLYFTTMSTAKDSKKRKTPDYIQKVPARTFPIQREKVMVKRGPVRTDQMYHDNKDIQCVTIWNNKGGVGKTTIACELATMYAQQFPETRVLLLDLSEQANASELLLGQDAVDDLLELDMNCLPSSSLVSYFDKVYQAAFAEKSIVVPLDAYLTPARHVPCSTIAVPTNLLVGATTLHLPMVMQMWERILNTMGYIWSQSERWTFMHTCLQQSLLQYQQTLQQPLAVIIDNGPQMTTSTAVGMVCAKQWILPLQPYQRQYSLTSAMRLLYGPPILSIQFSCQAKENNIKLPPITTFIHPPVLSNQQNRSVDVINDELDNATVQQVEKMARDFPHAPPPPSSNYLHFSTPQLSTLVATLHNN